MPLFTKQQTLCFYFACPVHCKLPQFSLEIGGNIVTEKQILMLSIGTLFFNIIQPNGDFNYKQYIPEENYLQFSCLINAYMDHQVRHPLLEIRSHAINECVFLLISPKSMCLPYLSNCSSRRQQRMPTKRQTHKVKLPSSLICVLILFEANFKCFK